MPAPCPLPATVTPLLQPPLALQCSHSAPCWVSRLVLAISCLRSCWGHKVCRLPAASSCFSSVPQFPLVIKWGDYSRSSSFPVLSLSKVPGRDSEAQGRNKGLAQGSQRPALPHLGKLHTSWDRVLVLCTGQEHKPLQNEPYEMGRSTEHPAALQPLTAELPAQTLTTEVGETGWRI